MIQLKTGNAWKGMLIVACAKGWEGGWGVSLPLRCFGFFPNVSPLKSPKPGAQE